MAALFVKVPLEKESTILAPVITLQVPLCHGSRRSFAALHTQIIQQPIHLRQRVHRQPATDLSRDR